MGLHWESICRNAVTGNVIDGVLYGKAKRWWGTVPGENGGYEQMELDVVAESIDKKSLLVGECKWTAQENAVRLISELKRKACLLPFAKNHDIKLFLFLKVAPKDAADNVLLPEDVIKLLRERSDMWVLVGKLES